MATSTDRVPIHDRNPTALLRAVAEATRILAERPSLAAGLDAALPVLGAAAGVDRVNVMRYDHDAAAKSLLAEWCRPGVPPASTIDPGPYPYADYAEVWRPLMAGEVYRAPLRDKTGANAALNVATATKTDLFVPVFVGGRFWGALNFDDCAAEPAWADGEIEALRAAAGAVAAAARREELEAEKVETVSREREAAAEQRATDQARRNELLGAANEASRVLIDSADFAHAIQTVLRTLAARFDVDRAALGRIDRVAGDPTPFCELLHEWVRPGVPRQMDDPALVRTPVAGPPEVVGAFFRGEPTQATPDELPEPARSQQAACRVRSQFGLPVLVDGVAWGVLGFDDCRRVRAWDAEEIAFLRVVASAVAAAVKRERAERETQEAVAREREAAAEERAAELQLANDAMRRSIAGLAGIDSLDGFLAEMLAAAMTAAGAHNGAVVLAWGAVAEHAVLVEHGRRVPRADQERDGTFRVPINDGLRAYIERTRDGGDVWAPPPDEVSHTPAFVAYHRRVGNRAVRNVPLVASGRVLGWLGLGFADNSPPSDARPALLRVLAEQMTVAVEMSRLADEARAAAVAREREAAAEQRAAELAKANVALRRGVERLVAGGDFDAAQNVLLLEAARAVGAAGGAVHEWVEGTSFTMRAMVNGGVVSRPQADHSDDTLFRRRTAADPTGTMRRTVAGVMHRIDLAALQDWFPEAASYHRAQGHQAVWHVPFRFGGRVAGSLALAFPDDPELCNEARETVQALAHQTWLAMESHRLATEAREAAVAKEREAAAEQRAAELAKANQALRRSVGGLTGVAEIRGFYRVALAEIATAVGASSAGLMLFDPRHRTFRMACSVLDGEDRPLAGTAHDRDWSLDDPVVARAWARIAAADTLLVEDIDGELVHPDTRVWHRERGDEKVLFVTVRRGDEPLGFIAFGSRSSAPLPPVSEELALALAQQVALAIELDRLGAAARAAAVAREREAAAEARAAELTKANAALRTGVAGLTRLGDLDQFLGEMLKAAAEVAGAHTGAVVLLDETGDRYRFACLLSRAGLVRPPGETAAGVPVSPALKRWLADTTRSSDFWELDPENEPCEPEAVRFHREQGNRALREVPMRAGDRLVGWLALGFADPEPALGGAYALLRGFADQMTLAVEMNRLADEARETAVARERAAAAERHLAEVETFNRAVRRSAARLAEGADVRDFLGHILAECLTLLGADFGHVLTYDPADATLAFAVGARPGEAYLTPRPDEADAFGAPIPAAAFPVFGLLRERRRPAVLSRDAGDAPPPDRVGRWFAAQGAREALCLLLAVGDEPVGFVGLVFRDPRVLRPEELELFEALANQAALAVALARLGDRAKAAAVSEERNRLARDIHDTLAQGFTGVVLHLQLALRALPADPDKAGGRVGAALDLARLGLQEARRSVWALLPEAIEAGDLPAALRRLADRLGATSGDAAVGFALDGDPRRLPAGAEAELLRVAQEALCNALKHAAATTVTVRLAYTPGAVRLSVEDDGRGFDPAAPREHGFGLTSMRERAARAGGAFAVDAAPGRGTRVSVTVPATQEPGEGRGDG